MWPRLKGDPDSASCPAPSQDPSLAARCGTAWATWFPPGNVYRLEEAHRKAHPEVLRGSRGQSSPTPTSSQDTPERRTHLTVLTLFVHHDILPIMDPQVKLLTVPSTLTLLGPVTFPALTPATLTSVLKCTCLPSEPLPVLTPTQTFTRLIDLVPSIPMALLPLAPSRLALDPSSHCFVLFPSRHSQ